MYSAARDNSFIFNELSICFRARRSIKLFRKAEMLKRLADVSEIKYKYVIFNTYRKP